MEKIKETKVTAEYVNDKMESMVSAMFDTIMETEERLKNLELKYHELKNGKSKVS